MWTKLRVDEELLYDSVSLSDGHSALYRMHKWLFHKPWKVHIRLRIRWEGWFISILLFMVERNLMLRKSVLYFVYGLRERVCTIVFGFGLTILAWSLLFDPKAEHSTKSHKVFTYVTKLLVAFFMFAAIWLFRILSVKLMASTCHFNTIF